MNEDYIKLLAHQVYAYYIDLLEEGADSQLALDLCRSYTQAVLILAASPDGGRHGN
jgi:hypothetical protein